MWLSDGPDGVGAPMKVRRRPHVESERATILCFHGIGEPGSDTSVDERDYWLSERAFHDILDVVAERPGIELTFDDGFSSDVSIVLPALVERGLDAMFFPVMGRLGQAGFIDASDIAALDQAGMGLGIHGWTHRVWVDLTPAELVEELEKSRSQLSELLGRPITDGACPLGRYDRRVLAVLRDLGFVTVYTSDRAVSRRDAWLRPRFTVRDHDSVHDVIAILDRHPSAARDGRDSLRLLAKRQRSTRRQAPAPDRWLDGMDLTTER